MNVAGVLSRLKLEWNQWRRSHQARINLHRYKDWIASIERNLPEVCIGPDLPYGGVRGHIRAIGRYSKLRTEIVPNESALGGLDRFSETLRKQFQEFELPVSSVVHSHVIPWFIDWCATQQSRGCPWIHTYHLNYFPEHSRGGQLREDQIAINEALLRTARNADIKLSVAKWQCHWLRQEHGIETQYLPNGVDIELCERGNGDRFRRRNSLTDPFLLWVGRNDPVKNPRDFVRLAEEMRDKKFVMIGSGLNDRSLGDEWEMEKPDNLILLGENTSAEVQDAIAACEALIVTSHREGLPTLVLEGMAQSRPIIAFEEPGSAEALGGGEFGYLARMGDIPSLAEMTRVALKDQTTPIKAKKRVLEEYDWKIVIEKLDRIYRSLLP